MSQSKEEHQNSEGETEGKSSNTDFDQDSDFSFSEDTDEEEIVRMDIEDEEWIDYIKRSTKEAAEQMKAAKIPCWIETQRKMEWRMAMRMVSLPEERWSRKASEWNPGLNTDIKTNRPVWEDQEKDGKMKSMTS